MHRKEIDPTTAWAADTGIYASGDLVGAQSSGILVFPNVVTTLAIEGVVSADYRLVVIEKVLITDVGKQNAPFDLLLFNANPSASTWTDQAAAAIHTNDLAKHKATISVGASDYIQTANASKVTIENRAEGLASLLMDATSLYIAAVVRGTPTYPAATDLKIALVVQIGFGD